MLWSKKKPRALLERPGPLLQITVKARCLACGAEHEFELEPQRERDLFVAEVAQWLELLNDACRELVAGIKKA